MRQPKYRRHKSGQARVTIAGRDVYLGKFGTPESKRAYDRVIAEWLASGRSELFGVPDDRLTIAHVLLAYLKHCRTYYGTESSSEYHRVKPVAKALKDLYGASIAAEFGPLQAKAVLEHLKRSGDRSRSYLAKLLAMLKRFFSWAATENLVPASVASAVKMVAAERRGKSKLRETEPVRPVARETVEATLPHLSSVVADMVRFHWFTGCRPGELCSITPGMVDRSGEVWQIRLEHHKNAHRGKERIIYVQKDGQEVLAKYLLRSADSPCFSPKDATRERNKQRHEDRVTPLSCGNRPGKNRRKSPARTAGEGYTNQSYARAVARACERAFPPPESLKGEAALNKWRRDHSWSPNQIRHAYATKSRAENGLDTTSVLLGHSNVRTTEIYAEADRAKAIEAVRRMSF
jgi:integrase